MYTVESPQERRENRKRLILDIIRNEPGISRTRVKQLSGLSMDSTLSLIAELLEENLILDGEKSDTGRAGRKAIPLTINPKGCCFIGIRFSADWMTGVCMDFSRQILCENSTELPPHPDQNLALKKMREVIRDLLLGRPDPSVPLRGIGIGAPGLVDPEKGVIRRYVHIPGCENLPLGQLLQEEFHVPVYVENGVRSSAQAFLRKAENKGLRHLIYVQIGYGVNMCAFSGGQLLNGSSETAGEIGHIPIEGYDGLCACGNRGCLETIAGRNALHRRVQEGCLEHPEKFSHLQGHLREGLSFGTDTFLYSAEEGDEGLREIFRSSGHAVGMALSTVITILNPEKVVVCGKLSRSSSFREGCMQAIQGHALREMLSGLPILYEDSDHRNDAIGAAGLPFQALFGV